MGYWEIILLLAINCWHECPDEPVQGQLAVSHVLQNRARQRGTTIDHELFRPRQFSWTEGRRRDTVLRFRNSDDYGKFARCLAISALAYATPDLTGGANHYHADYISKPAWAKRMKEVAHIGSHIFYVGEYGDSSQEGASDDALLFPPPNGSRAPVSQEAVTAMAEASHVAATAKCLMPSVAGTPLEGRTSYLVGLPTCSAPAAGLHARGPP